MKQVTAGRCYRTGFPLVLQASRKARRYTFLGEGKYIFRFHTKYKDFGANNLPSAKEYLVIEDFGAGFQHPFKKNISVIVALSQRAQPSAIKSDFGKLATKFISSIEFYDFNDQ